jgi:hypothetical protein
MADEVGARDGTMGSKGPRPLCWRGRAGAGRGGLKQKRWRIGHCAAMGGEKSSGAHLPAGFVLAAESQEASPTVSAPSSGAFIARKEGAAQHPVHTASSILSRNPQRGRTGAGSRLQKTHCTVGGHWKQKSRASSCGAVTSKSVSPLFLQHVIRVARWTMGGHMTCAGPLYMYLEFLPWGCLHRAPRNTSASAYLIDDRRRALQLLNICSFVIQNHKHTSRQSTFSPSHHHRHLHLSLERHVRPAPRPHPRTTQPDATKISPDSPPVQSRQPRAAQQHDSSTIPEATTRAEKTPPATSSHPPFPPISHRPGS